MIALKNGRLFVIKRLTQSDLKYQIPEIDAISKHIMFIYNYLCKCKDGLQKNVIAL